MIVATIIPADISINIPLFKSIPTPTVMANVRNGAAILFNIAFLSLAGLLGGFFTSTDSVGISIYILGDLLYSIPSFLYGFIFKDCINFISNVLPVIDIWSL